MPISPSRSKVRRNAAFSESRSAGICKVFTIEDANLPEDLPCSKVHPGDTSQSGREYEAEEDQNVAKYLFVYHGGKAPTNPAEIQEVMNAWGAWFGSLGAAVIDGGNPVGKSSTVRPDGSLASDGGANPASGYSLIEASSLEDAHKKPPALALR
jgi:hypothetical protein